MLEINRIHQGDCIILMKDIPDKSVNLILCDLPYGVTQNEADKVIDFEKLWEQYKRIIKDNGTIVLTAQQPFTTDLINSNRGMFRYDIIWDKRLVTGFLNAKRMPLRSHEHILIFYKSLGIYNPQFTIGNPLHSKGINYKNKDIKNQNYGKFVQLDDNRKGSLEKYPVSIIRIDKKHPSIQEHPTEKPIELAEWIIKTYSNEGDLILDNCTGTGWTAIASKMFNRNFIGIELEQRYVDICNKRIMEVKSGCDANDDGIPPNNKLLGILPNEL